jgi:choline dehydrogenase-like flavoprotein
MLSGIGNAKDLSALGIKPIVNNPSVGANLTDHPAMTNIWYVNSTATFDAIVRNGTLAAADIAAWQQTQTGPLVDTPLAHLVWSRVPSNAFSIPDPAAGPNTAHYELLFTVRFSRILFFFWRFTMNTEWLGQAVSDSRDGEFPDDSVGRDSPILWYVFQYHYQSVW